MSFYVNESDTLLRREQVRVSDLNSASMSVMRRNNGESGKGKKLVVLIKARASSSSASTMTTKDANIAAREAIKSIQNRKLLAMIAPIA